MRKDVSRLCILGLSRRGLISASAVGIFGQAEAQVATRGTNDLSFNAETISSLPRFGKWEVIVIVSVRFATASDVESCGRIIYEAFKGINENHGFPQDFPSIEAATQLATAFIAHPLIFGVVAASEGRVVGSNFLDERDPVRAVGPTTVDPALQARGIGRRLMEAVLERGRDATAIRLVQDAFNTRSISLYTSLGFDVKEPLMLMRGTPRNELMAGFEVRPLTSDDVKACAALCERVDGTARTNELRDSLRMFTPFVVEREGRMTGYLSAATSWIQNHGVAETEQDMKALILGTGAASAEPLSFLLPVRQSNLFRWCLSEGIRVVKPMTLMAIGHYREPQGTYFPTVSY